MESVIGYRFGTLPHQPIHMSSGYNAAITTKPYCFSHFSTKPHLSFSQNSSFSLHKSSRGRPLEHILGPINFTVGYPSTSLTDQKSRLPQAFTAEHFLEVVAVAKELKSSGHKDIAEKLMTIHEPQIDTPGEPADRHCKEKMKILEILIAEGMFPEASKYSADIDSHMSSYKPHLDSDVFKNLKFVIFCGQNHHSEASKLRENLEKPPVGPQENLGQKPPVVPQEKPPVVPQVKLPVVPQENLGQKPPIVPQENLGQKTPVVPQVKPPVVPQENLGQKPPVVPQEKAPVVPQVKLPVVPQENLGQKPQENPPPVA